MCRRSWPQIRRRSSWLQRPQSHTTIRGESGRCEDVVRSNLGSPALQHWTLRVGLNREKTAFKGPVLAKETWISIASIPRLPPLSSSSSPLLPQSTFNAYSHPPMPSKHFEYALSTRMSGVTPESDNFLLFITLHCKQAGATVYKHRLKKVPK